jgi:hypothetical protein
LRKSEKGKLGREKGKSRSWRRIGELEAGNGE